MTFAADARSGGTQGPSSRTGNVLAQMLVEGIGSMHSFQYAVTAGPLVGLPLSFTPLPSHLDPNPSPYSLPILPSAVVGQ